LIDVILDVMKDGDNLIEITQKIILQHPKYITEDLGFGGEDFPQIQGIVAQRLIDAEDAYFVVDRSGTPYRYYVRRNDNVKPEQSEREFKEGIIDQEMWNIIHNLEEMEMIQSRMTNSRLRIRDLKMSMEV